MASELIDIAGTSELSDGLDKELEHLEGYLRHQGCI